MQTTSAAKAFAALGHEARLNVFRLLMRHAPRALRPTEIAEVLSLKANTLSGYLSDLQDAGLVQVTRHGRTLHYSANLSGAEGIVGYLVNDCCRSRPSACLPQITGPMGNVEPLPADKPLEVLFFCSANSARSIMAEALLRDIGKGRFAVHSAGIDPSAAPHKEVLELLQSEGHEISGLQSKGIDTFQGEAAPNLDFVFSVCDLAAHEDAAPWKGQPISTHWGLPDPVRSLTQESQRTQAIGETYQTLHRRISRFAELPFDQLDRAALQSKIDEISIN